MNAPTPVSSEDRYTIAKMRHGEVIRLEIIDRLNGSVVASSVLSNVNQVEQFVHLANKAWKAIK